MIGAVPGYSTFQSRRLFARVADEVRPDVVVIGNLWSDAYFAAVSDEAWAAELAETYGPWQPLVRPLALLSEHSALARRIREAVHTAYFPRKDTAHEIGWSHLVKPPPGPPKPPPKHGSAGLPTARVPLDAYATNLRAMVAAVREVGALPAFLMLPHPLDANRIHGLPSHERSYRDVMRTVAAESGAPLVDGPAWYATHPWETSRFADDIHPDAKGHADLADAAFAAFAADAAIAARLGIPQRASDAATQSTPGER
ncbi:MAG: SGNH/GDSL hydrolase family protein [Myxococcota bacterium]